MTVYRVEGPGNERLELTVGRLSSAQLSIGGGTNQLYLNFGDRSRAVDFLGKRYSQGTLTTLSRDSTSTSRISTVYASRACRRASPAKALVARYE